MFDTFTTICSGFDNTCETKFKSINLKISFINEINHFQEDFNTTVTVLKKSKIDLIIGRETIKKYNLCKRLPSHFEASIKLTDDYQLIKEPFADKNSEELYGYYPSSNQPSNDRAFPVKKHAHTCTSILNPQVRDVGDDGLSVNSRKQTRNKKTEEKDCERYSQRGPPSTRGLGLLQGRSQETISDTNPMCYCDKALPWGSRVNQTDHLTPMRIQDGIETVATSLVGGSETHPSQHTTTTVNHCECLSSTVWKPKNSWLLQSDGSYKPVPYEQVGRDLLNSEVVGVINPLPRITTPPRVVQTWGIIAT